MNTLRVWRAHTEAATHTRRMDGRAHPETAGAKRIKQVGCEGFHALTVKALHALLLEKGVSDLPLYYCLGNHLAFPKLLKKRYPDALWQTYNNDLALCFREDKLKTKLAELLAKNGGTVISPCLKCVHTCDMYLEAVRT